MKIPGVFARIDLSGNSFGEPPELSVRHTDIDTSSAPMLSSRGVFAAASEGWAMSRDGIYCAISGNIDWLAADLADLQLKHDPAHALLHAYQRDGADCLDRIGGRFSLLIWNGKEKKLLVAHDRFGQIPVFWTKATDGSLFIGPLATWVSANASNPHSLSDQAVFDFLYYHVVPSPGTIFRDVNKLPAGHALFADHKDTNVRRYWVPDFRENEDKPRTEANAELTGLLSSSVARLTDSENTGSFLSGGLDSTTISGFLSRRIQKADTYSIGFDAEGYDEIQYARIASERYGTTFNSYYVTPADVVSALPDIAAAYDEPFGNSSVLPAFFCARLAVDGGKKRLLAGDGGDELFAGNERYAKQTVFDKYRLLPRTLRRYAIEPILNQSFVESNRVLRKARSYAQQANIALPERLQIYNFLNRFEIDAIISDQFAASVDRNHPTELDRQLYNEPAEASPLNRMLYLDWHHTLADNDLRKVNRMCELAGIEVEYPMLDDRLVEFSTRISSARKMRGNRLRDFYKNAMSELLPAEILNKPKHGFGLPFGVWLSDDKALQQMAGDHLSRFKRRKFVKPSFIDDIVRMHKEQHAGYYGEFIWVMMMFELWLTAQGLEP